MRGVFPALSSACYFGIMSFRGAFCMPRAPGARNSIECQAGDTSHNTLRAPQEFADAFAVADARGLSRRRSHRRINRSRANETTEFLSFQRENRAIVLSGQISTGCKTPRHRPDVINVRSRLIHHGKRNDPGVLVVGLHIRSYINIFESQYFVPASSTRE